MRRLGYETSVIYSLFKRLQTIIYRDAWELHYLLIQPRLVQSARSPYSHDVLNMILERHTDGILHGIITSILSLESSEDRLAWAKAQEKQGMDLLGWHTKRVKNWESIRNGAVGEAPPAEANVLSLVMDERKTKSSYRMLLKKRRE
jgi:hypothetical protein